ncbi:molybdopterin converting factor, subunit 2 family protein [Coccidioides posadasii C735 delta SOWgp]|uniref:Molybdopterin synthase catalytic subunit n=2 Tax=Coccidioides posadasii TaxID=199306 RepID=A0A0J6I9U4_COCPO|nr:molybdopterin converting factor, subunit 2 family protein [Coccidioides posadasii C735 delta SOWgp]EER24783.1 molybdopterin converting factor, subunit 2 family protein [Coccidioides posadasii C735 delta SOWgp]KMM68367.1 molybdopterin-converting factor subunit 2 [Coccidioides posadasii RMSCC 3488]|eukprot:XP_003066928.1 molybdopterin converting factor, subunit 2 family protein [Coccidioides posadasii C735 delta SOWgp]
MSTLPSTDPPHLPASTSSQQPAVHIPPPSYLDPTTYPQTLYLDPERIFIELTYHPLSPSTYLAHTRSPAAGANVLFLGTTRDTFEDKPVARLAYTSYAPLALRTLSSIARDAVAKHGLCGVSIAHRLGDVAVGEESIAIAISAPHRGAAWRAGEEVLEECKRRVEIWKREEFVGEPPGQGEWRANRDTDPEGKSTS